MKAHFEPRRRKISGPPMSGNQKSVRIDRNTLICVSASIPDQEAIDRYNMRHNSKKYPSAVNLTPITPDEALKEIPMGSIEELSQIIDDSNLPEIE